ncbi:hypothetical protein QU481_03245 [Crenobacter sp. SG2303]|uniref:Uncharacterized protein n=1 Tax=Crenobacter oryzisoli TaxID=3056844 RepID=A0ABT7XJD8_9NEIS|nr:hypothetical protein [Crenobacter sp. SG2303]MDN0073907.1 hypothetical protein [Crenobacter sp. SG2303]
MKKLSFILMLLASPLVSAEETTVKSPEKLESISYTCSDSSCTAWVNSNGTKKTIFQDIPTSSVSARWLSSKLAQISFSCGSPCSVSFFYKKENGVSRPVQDAMAVDANRSCVLKPVEDGLSIAPIFSKDDSKKFWYVKYNDSQFQFYTKSAVIFSTIKAHFNSDGKLELHYINSKNHDAYRKIDKKCPDIQ